MLSPLKPLLCRHDFYWSERHLSERCRRCGKHRTAEAVEVSGRAKGVVERASTPAPGALPSFIPPEGVFIDFDDRRLRPLRSPGMLRPGAKALKAQARERRETLLGWLDRLVEGARPTREEAIDGVLALIEDAHSAEPVLFGADAAGHFARLHQARVALSLRPGNAA